MNLDVFKRKKLEGQKLSMMTCYDYSSARLIKDSRLDAVLVGDSLAMTIYGFDSTLPATVEMMALHTAAVRRGLGPKVALVADLPFLEHRGSIDRSLDAVRKLMVAGADAIKIEGLKGHEAVLERIIESGIPVMGHLGLTPQSVHGFGGYRVQGKQEEQAKRMIDEALTLEKLGAFALVLECVPAQLARQITDELQISTIGIGAGPSTDGQILVMQDLLGINVDFKPKFARHFANTHQSWIEAINEYCTDTSVQNFPTAEESY